MSKVCQWVRTPAVSIFKSLSHKQSNAVIPIQHIYMLFFYLPPQLLKMQFQSPKPLVITYKLVLAI